MVWLHEQNSVHSKNIVQQKLNLLEKVCLCWCLIFHFESIQMYASEYNKSSSNAEKHLFPAILISGFILHVPSFFENISNSQISPILVDNYQKNLTAVVVGDVLFLLLFD